MRAARPAQDSVEPPKPRRFVCLEGNSCDGSFGRFAEIQAAKGNIVDVIDYFGKCFTPDEIREYIFSKLARLNVNEYVLIGSSFGGHLSIDIVNQTLSSDGKPTITGWILTGTPPAGKNWTEAFNTPIETVEEGGRPVLALLSCNTPMTYDEAKRFMSAFGWDKVDPDTLIGDDKKLFDHIMTRLQAQPTAELDLPKTRSEILGKYLGTYGDEKAITAECAQKVPLCIIHGAKDPVISLPYLERMITDDVKVFEDKIHVIDTHHYAQWTAAQEFSDTVDRFVDSL
jgi:pimeloyl-ACP methyl ester carboxylesterase